MKAIEMPGRNILISFIVDASEAVILSGKLPSRRAYCPKLLAGFSVYWLNPILIESV